MKYFIIGGAGVFALHTIKKLLDIKSTTKVFSVGRSFERSSAFTLDIGKNDKRYAYKQIHLTFEIDTMIEMLDKIKPDYIINFAALAHATSWKKSFRYYDTNITALAKLCEHLYDKKYLKQFLQIGSSEIYGPTLSPAKETDIPNPTSPYAISKLSADYHILSCYNYNGFPGNIIRPSNCYGPTQLMYRIIPKAILFGLMDKPFPLEGGGVSKKSFMHASDLAESIIKILHSKKLGQIYNAGTNKPVTMKYIIELIAKKLSLDTKEFIQITKARKGEDKQYWINSDKIKKELNWAPKISLESGIDECIEWVLKYKKDLEKETTEFTLRA
jgi:dTDP-glucose 4,6-dehydratase